MPILEINKDSFQKEVLESNQRVLVDFYADWCGPCKMVKPILEELAESDQDVRIAAVNIDDEDELAEKYEVSSIPCLVLFEGGNEVKRSVGMVSKAKIEKMIGK